MSRLFKRMVLGMVALGLGMLALGGLMVGSGIRVNTSPSLPLGIYKTSQAAVSKDTLVLFCPPLQSVFEEARARDYIGAGFCPDGFREMMKKVVAVTGDRVSITAQGVTVNGLLLPHSTPLQVDGKGRPLPQLTLSFSQLGEEELLLMGDRSATSFDARYFGIVSRTQVKFVVRPLLTW